MEGLNLASHLVLAWSVVALVDPWVVVQWDELDSEVDPQLDLAVVEVCLQVQLDAVLRRLLPLHLLLAGVDLRPGFQECQDDLVVFLALVVEK